MNSNDNINIGASEQALFPFYRNSPRLNTNLSQRRCFTVGETGKKRRPPSRCGIYLLFIVKCRPMTIL